MSVLRCEHCGHCTLDPEHVCTKPPRTAESAVELLRDGTPGQGAYATWLDLACTSRVAAKVETAAEWSDVAHDFDHAHVADNERRTAKACRDAAKQLAEGLVESALQTLADEAGIPVARWVEIVREGALRRSGKAPEGLWIDATSEGA